MYHNETIDWVGDGPPIDEPPCGFRGERCIPEPCKFLLLLVKYFSW